MSTLKITALVVVVLILLIFLTGCVWLWTPDLSRAKVAARYLRSPADMIRVAGTRLHVRDAGPRDAPAIIMIPGFGSSLQTWNGWADELSDRFRVVRLDLPGSGLSPPDPTGVYTDARTIDILIALMDHLGIARADFVGNSIGGRIAWTLAAGHPKRVDKLVLVSPDGFASPGADYGQPPTVPRTLALMRYFLPKSMVRSNLEVGYGDPARLSAATVNRYYDLLRAPGVRAALLARMRQTVRIDPVPLLHQIQAPVLLVWGEKDRMIPIANAADYEQNLPHSRLVRFAQLGHVPQEEAPSKSVAPVRTFLEADEFDD